MKNHLNSNTISNQRIILYSFLIFFFCLLIFVMGLSFTFETTPKSFFIAFTKGFFQPTPNYCVTDNIFTVNIMKLLYAFLFLLLLTIGCLGVFVKNSSIPWKKLSLKILSSSVIIFMLFLCTLQQISRLKYLEREQFFVYRRSSDISLLREFTSQVKKMLPGRHQAKIESDQNLSIDPYQLMQRTLSYYLYPEFSVRFDNGYPQDCIFYFDKKDFTKGLPQGYQLIYANRTGYLAVAIKKEVLPNAD